MSLSDIELSSRLAGADRGAAVAHDDDVLASLAEETRRAARRRRLRIRVVGAGAIAALLIGAAVSAPAVADGIQRFLAQSDPQALAMNALTATPPPGSPDCGEAACGSEWVNAGAPDIGEYVAGVYEDWLPLAPGQTEAQLIGYVSRSAENLSGGLAQKALFQQQFEWLVLDGWVNDWLAAQQAGDAAGKARAVDVILEVPDWPGMQAGRGGGLPTMIRILGQSMAAGNDSDGFALGWLESINAYYFDIGPLDGIDYSGRIQEVNCQALAVEDPSAICFTTPQTGPPQ